MKTLNVIRLSELSQATRDGAAQLSKLLLHLLYSKILLTHTAWVNLAKQAIRGQNTFLSASEQLSPFYSAFHFRKSQFALFPHKIVFLSFFYPSVSRCYLLFVICCLSLQLSRIWNDVTRLTWYIQLIRVLHKVILLSPNVLRSSPDQEHVRPTARLLFTVHRLLMPMLAKPCVVRSYQAACFTPSGVTAYGALPDPTESYTVAKVQRDHRGGENVT